MPKGQKGFSKGVSGNPNGRPKAPDEVRKAFTNPKNTMKAVMTILELMDNPSPKIALDASKEWLDRALGKAVQQVDAKTEVTTPVNITFEGNLDEWSK